jgi:predicted signal transduction protein with EAL and GGDEF domain
MRGELGLRRELSCVVSDSNEPSMTVLSSASDDFHARATMARDPGPGGARQPGTVPSPEFESQLHAQIVQCRRRAQGLALLWIELDLPAAHGLLEPARVDDMGRRLLRRVRSTDQVVRIGQRSFCVVLPGAIFSVGQRVTLRLRAALAEPYQGGAIRPGLAARLGHAQFPEDGDTAGILLHQARAELRL